VAGSWLWWVLGSGVVEFGMLAYAIGVVDHGCDGDDVLGMDWWVWLGLLIVVMGSGGAVCQEVVEGGALSWIGCHSVTFNGCHLQVVLEGAVKIVASVQSSGSFALQGLP